MRKKVRIENCTVWECAPLAKFRCCCCCFGICWALGPSLSRLRTVRTWRVERPNIFANAEQQSPKAQGPRSYIRVAYRYVELYGFITHAGLVYSITTIILYTYRQAYSTTVFRAYSDSVLQQFNPWSWRIDCSIHIARWLNAKPDSIVLLATHEVTSYYCGSLVLLGSLLHRPSCLMPDRKTHQHIRIDRILHNRNTRYQYNHTWIRMFVVWIKQIRFL